MLTISYQYNTIKDTKLYVPARTISERDNKKLSKLLSKRFEKSGCWNEYTTKIENRTTTNVLRSFLESKLVRVKNNIKRFKAKIYY